MSFDEDVTALGAAQSSAWGIAVISMALLMSLIFVLFQHTFLYLAGLWNQFDTGDYAHGYLVLGISVYLIAINRKKLAALTPSPSYLALPLVLLASLLWLMAVLVDVNVAQTAALLLLLLAVVWAVMGHRVTLELAFPILFVGFALPIWFPLSPILQDITADVVFWVVRTIEIPAARNENNILLPAGTFAIEEACSGLRYMLAALTLGTLYAYLNYHTLRARIIVVLVSAAAGILANMLRVFIVVYLGYQTDMQHPYVNDHLMLGWYLFGALIVLLLVLETRIHRRFQRQELVDNAQKKPVQDDHTAAALMTRRTLSYVTAVVASALMLSVGPVVAYMVNTQPAHDNEAIAINIPSSIAGWAAQPDSQDDWTPVYPGASVRKQVYRKSDDYIFLYVGCYMAQQQGKELINDVNRINNKEVWKTGYPRARLIDTADHPVLEQALETIHGERRLVWYWYQVADRITANAYQAKMLQLLGLLTGIKQACVIAVSTEVGEDRDMARNKLAEFASNTGPIESRVPD